MKKEEKTKGAPESKKETLDVFAFRSVAMSVCKHHLLEKTLQNIAAMVVFFLSPSTLPHSLYALGEPSVSYFFYCCL
jgi:hypothetical protein